MLSAVRGGPHSIHLEFKNEDGKIDSIVKRRSGMWRAQKLYENEIESTKQKLRGCGNHAATQQHTFSEKLFEQPSTLGVETRYALVSTKSDAISLK